MFALRIDDLPPSVNGSTAVVKGRKISSAAYRAWTKAAIWQLNPQAGIKGDRYWCAQIMVPGSSGVDLDNHVKQILDALRKAGKTPDDRRLCNLQVSFWAQGYIEATVWTEDAAIWGPIRGASKQLIKKLGG